MSQVVIGGGPSGVVAAAALEGAVLLDPDRHVGGLEWTEVPVDRGVCDAANAETVAQLAGGAPVATGFGKGLWAGGQVWSLPFQRRELRTILPDSGRALVEWTRARAELVARDSLLGGGYEERTYKDWVVQRYGGSAFRLLYGPYAHKRFGDPEVAGVSLARLHHGLVLDEGLVGVGATPAAGIEAMLSGVDVRTDVGLAGIELEDDHVKRVLTSDGAVDCDELFLACTLADAAELLGDQLPLGIRTDIGVFTTRHRLQVVVTAELPGDMPAEVHVVDDAPFFRVTVPELLPGGDALAGKLIAHVAVDDGDPLWTSGDGRVVEAVVAGLASTGIARAHDGDARVVRLADWDPAWTGPWHPAWHRVAAWFHKRGIRLVGRVATHRHADLGASLAHAQHVANAADDYHEAGRIRLDPPVRLDDLDVSITRFVER